MLRKYLEVVQTNRVFAETVSYIYISTHYTLLFTSLVSFTNIEGMEKKILLSVNDISLIILCTY